MNTKNKIFEGKKSNFLLKHEYVLVSFLLYESKLNVFLAVDKIKHLKTSPSDLENPDFHFFIAQKTI